MRFSFIVPVYGVERYLRDCVSSLLAQQGELEVILVDDRSPDGCPALCDELARQDDRVRVIHKPRNEGLGFARNTGLAEAKGEYVIFADSDDRVSPELLAVCEPHLADAPDILVFGVRCGYENAAGETTWTEILSPERKSTAKGDPLADVFMALNEARVFPFAWNKVYRRAFLEENGLRFESTELIEDFLFNIAVFAASPSAAAIPEALYTYRRHAHETLVNKYSPAFFTLAKRKYGLEKAFLKQQNALDEANASFFAYAFLKHVISAAVRNRSERAALPVKRQKELAREMLRDPVTKQALADFRPVGAKQALIAARLAKEDTSFLLALATVSGFSQQKAVGFFKKHIRK